MLNLFFQLLSCKNACDFIGALNELQEDKCLYVGGLEISTSLKTFSILLS